MIFLIRYKKERVKMNYRRMTNVRQYLCRFDQILDTMEEKMLSSKPCNNITKYFIECMVPHHRAAIYMCENLLQYTTYQPLQQISHHIIQTQSRGIEQMEEIDRTTRGILNTPREVETYTKKYLEITKDMIGKMRNSPRYCNINLNFVGEMIPHHEGAISMCKNLLQYRMDPRLRMVAESIIKEQSQGVKQLEQIRKNLCR